MSNPNSSQPQGQGARDGRDGNDSRDSRDHVPNPLQPAPPEGEFHQNPTYGDDLLHRQFPTRTYYYILLQYCRINPSDNLERRVVRAAAL